MDDVANYRDPVPGPMGWGDDTLQIEQRRAIERDHMESLSVAVMAGAAKPAGKMPAKIEAVIRKRFKFDAGWSFLIADKLVYGVDLMMSQLIGNCVGASHSLLLARRIAHEILAEGQAEDPLGRGMLGCPWIPYSYGVGRLAGGMLGPGDGSYCGAQIEGTQTYGFVPCYTKGLDKYGGTLPQSSGDANRLLGRSKAEIEKWMPSAKQFDLVEAPIARTGDEAWSLVVDKQIPLQICSGWGFRYKGFDSKYGVELYVPGGSWSHSMQIVAMFEIKSTRFVCIGNQWGEDAHRGSPDIGIPGGYFVITFDDFSRWIKQSETIGIGEIKGLPSNPGF